MQGVIYLFFNNVMATHLCDTLLSPSSGVQFQNLGQRLTSVTLCFPLLPGCSSTTSNSSSPQRLLAFPSSGVPNQNLGQQLTSETTCFSLLPGCRAEFFSLTTSPVPRPCKMHLTKVSRFAKACLAPKGPAFRLVPRNIS